MSFLQVLRVFVEYYLASRSYLTCQNEFTDTFPDSPVPNKSTISCLVNRFRNTGSVQDRNRSGRPSVLMQQCFLFSDFNVIYFLTNRTCARNRLCDFFDHPVYEGTRCKTFRSHFLNKQEFNIILSEAYIHQRDYVDVCTLTLK
jgi:hypothetical protein